MKRHVAVLLALLLPAAACARHGVPSRPTADGQRPTTVTQSDVAPDSVAARLLVDVQAVEPSIRVEARYATANNFTGAALPGYGADRVLLRREAAAALARAQWRAIVDGYSLKVFDGYRPVRATLAMVDWTERVGRQDLIRDGYIAARSGHNLGLAVDLTLVRAADGRELDMGTAYDVFSEAAHTANASGTVAANRARLTRYLESEGFANYAKEWWHFSYAARDPLRFDIEIR